MEKDDGKDDGGGARSELETGAVGEGTLGVGRERLRWKVVRVVRVRRRRSGCRAMVRIWGRRGKMLGFSRRV